MKAAVLIDGAFLGKVWPYYQKFFGDFTSKNIICFVKNIINELDAELFRIYYYDCYPSEIEVLRPIDGKSVKLGTTLEHYRMLSLLNSLKVCDNLALRKGELKFRGWKLGKSALKAIQTGKLTKTSAGCFVPDLRQKSVDMKIGLDAAWLASKRIVDTIVLVMKDRDFLPVMKFTRREGVKIVTVTPQRPYLAELHEHSDLYITFESLCSKCYTKKSH